MYSCYMILTTCRENNVDVMKLAFTIKYTNEKKRREQ